MTGTTRYTFTVFTPTFERAGTLGRVHRSLERQTFRDFEWLVVDDGSTDGTEGLVANWAATSAFPIRYVRQDHAGKHAATNLAVDIARGELFLTLDSDDECVPQALECLKHHWDAILPGARDRYAGVTGLCVDQHGALVGDPFPADVLDSTPIELVYRHRVRGEKWGFTRTDLLRAYPFPSLEGVTFVAEGLVWDVIGERYRTRYVNERLRVYWIRTEAEEARRRTAVDQGVALGLAAWHAHVLDRHLPWFRLAPLAFLRSAISYARFSAGAGRSPLDQFRGLRRRPARALWAASLPLGYLARGIDVARGRGPPSNHPRGSIDNTSTIRRMPVIGTGAGKDGARRTNPRAAQKSTCRSDRFRRECPQHRCRRSRGRGEDGAGIRPWAIWPCLPRWGCCLRLPSSWRTG